MKTYEQLNIQCRRIQIKIADQTRRRTRLAHPATEGMPGLIGNWGNEEARRLLRVEAQRHDRVYRAFHKLSRAAMHRDHIAEGKDGAYRWCEHCDANREAYDRSQQTRIVEARSAPPPRVIPPSTLSLTLTPGLGHRRAQTGKGAKRCRLA